MKLAVIGAALLLGLVLKPALANDPWQAADLVQPQALEAKLSSNPEPPPTILFVGFPVLYRAGHVPKAILAGTASTAAGLEAMKKAVRELPKDREIVLYCGCCPFVKCPNVRPAYSTLRQMGFEHVKVMVLTTNFHTDWVALGYPVAK